MTKVIQIGQLVVAILLTVAILAQNSNSGLSGLFGGLGNIYRTKRGVEKNLFIATIVLAALFLGSALLSLFVK